MKKLIIIVCVVSVLATSLIVPASAAWSYTNTNGYPYLVYDGSALNFVSLVLPNVTNEVNAFVLDVSPNLSSYQYRSVISYDDLASLVLDACTSGIVTSLYKNERAGYWVAYVTDYDTQWIPFIETDRVYGCLGSIDGYVYVAEIDTTGDESVRALKNIQSIAQAIHYTQQALYNFMREAASDLSYIKMYTDQLANEFNPTKSGTLGEQILHMKSYLYSLDTAVKSLSTQISAQSTKLDSIVTNVAKLDDIHSEITEPNVSGTLAYNIKTIATKTVNIATQLTDFSTSGTLATYVKNMQTNTTSIAAGTNQIIPNILGQIRNNTASISGDTTDLVTLLDPSYSGQATTLASYIVRICEAVESADSSTTVDTSALETKIDDLHNSLNHYTGVSLAELMEAWWEEMSDGFSAVDSDLNLMNSYLSSIKSTSTTLNNNMITLNGYITDDLEDIYGRLSEILSAVDDDNGSLNSGFATANGHLSNIKSYTNSIKSYTNSLNTNITDIETLLTNWERPTFDTTALESAVSTFQTSVESDFDDLGTKVDTVATNVATVTTALGTANSHLNTSKGYLKNIQSYTSNMKTNVADIETLLTNWEHPTFDTTALEGKVNDTNAYLSQISDKLDDLTESTVENITNITISNDNDAYSVFYLTDANGDEESIAEFGGDVLTAGGKLLNFFFRVAFDDALSNVDTAVDGMTDFYFDSVTVGEGASIWE